MNIKANNLFLTSWQFIIVIIIVASPNTCDIVNPLWNIKFTDISPKY